MERGANAEGHQEGRVPRRSEARRNLGARMARPSEGPSFTHCEQHGGRREAEGVREQHRLHSPTSGKASKREGELHTCLQGLEVRERAPEVEIRGGVPSEVPRPRIRVTRHPQHQPQAPTQWSHVSSDPRPDAEQQLADPSAKDETPATRPSGVRRPDIHQDLRGGQHLHHAEEEAHEDCLVSPGRHGNRAGPIAEGLGQPNTNPEPRVDSKPHGRTHRGFLLEPDGPLDQHRQEGARQVRRHV